jgi:hypothetical protein
METNLLLPAKHIFYTKIANLESLKDDHKKSIPIGVFFVLYPFLFQNLISTFSYGFISLLNCQVCNFDLFESLLIVFREGTFPKGGSRSLFGAGGLKPQYSHHFSS